MCNFFLAHFKPTAFSIQWGKINIIYGDINLQFHLILNMKLGKAKNILLGIFLLIYLNFTEYEPYDKYSSFRNFFALQPTKYELHRFFLHFEYLHSLFWHILIASVEF